MRTSAPDLAFLLRHPAHVLALGLGSGLAPRAPGTFGSLAAIPLYFGLLAPLPWVWQVVLIVVAFLIGIPGCGITGRALGKVDHGSIVWDEIVAMWMLLAAEPHGVASVVVVFGLFRLFDIVKPWPIGWLDRKLEIPFGVMLDDALAAGYVWLVMVVMVRWWPLAGRILHG